MNLQPQAVMIVVVASSEVSVWLHGAAMRSLPLDVVYPVWTAIGTMGSISFAAVLREGNGAVQIAALTLVRVGIVLRDQSTDPRRGAR